MNIISESATTWRPGVEPAVVPEKGAPKAIGSEDGIEEDGFQMFGEDGFTFMDFLDIINPLQHIPIVATLYREISGDDLDPGSRVIGDTLFMGPVGTAAALANVMIDDVTGKDVRKHVMAFFDDDTSTPPEVSDNGTRLVAISRAPSLTAIATEPTNPVTAWAMAETSYRKSAAGKIGANQVGGNAMVSAPASALS